MLEKDGEDRWTDRVKNEEVLRGVKRGEEYAACNKKKEG
jgi:hypothetical protein